MMMEFVIWISLVAGAVFVFFITIVIVFLAGCLLVELAKAVRAVLFGTADEKREAQDELGISERLKIPDKRKYCTNEKGLMLLLVGVLIGLELGE
jgi:hypothetical protein